VLSLSLLACVDLSRRIVVRRKKKAGGMDFFLNFHPFFTMRRKRLPKEKNKEKD